MTATALTVHQAAGARHARKGDSGTYVYFHFCPACGSTIYWEVEASPGKTGSQSAACRPLRSRHQMSLSSCRISTHGFRFPRASGRTKGTVRPSRPLRLLRLPPKSTQGYLAEAARPWRLVALRICSCWWRWIIRCSNGPSCAPSRRRLTRRRLRVS